MLCRGLSLLRELPSPCLRVGSSSGGRSRSFPFKLFPDPLSLRRASTVAANARPDELVGVCVCVCESGAQR